MTRSDLHPEDLLERAARGLASDADWARLEAHLAECSVCRVERALVAQVALDAAPLPDEKLALARLKREVAARLASPQARRSKRPGALVALAVAAGAVASVAAAASVVLIRPAPAPSTSSVPALPSARAANVHEARSVAAVLGDPAVPSVAVPVPSATPPARPAVPAAIEPSSASELFRRANQARREGRAAEAVRLYRALQERFSGSSEELVSRVTLGRLLLDRLGDSRGALVQFNSYLASPGGGALREEAMVGRALSLGRLGRTAEERAAWRAVLDAWPKSTHRKRAEARLGELPFADGARAAGPGSGISGGGRAQ